MINTQMRVYDYFTFGASDAYGQPTLSDQAQGQIQIAINITSQAIQDNINYKNANYIGLTFDKNIDDTYVIQYGASKLKVLYINPIGRYKQVFLTDYGNGF